MEIGLCVPHDGYEHSAVRFAQDMTRVDFGARKLLIMSNAGTSACAVTRKRSAMQVSLG